MAAKRIAIVGIGGTGCRLAGWLASGGGDGRRVVAIDSDTCALADADADVRIQIGEGLTGGFGAGGDEERGRLAADADCVRIMAELSGCDLVMLLLGAGGGIGSGGAPVLAVAARSAGIPTVCLAVTPFTCEGPQKQAVASRVLDALREVCDVMVAVPNDDLLARAESTVLADLYDRANPLLSKAVYALWQALSRPGYLRLDVADLRRLSGQTDGPCALGYADATGEGRALRVAEALLAGPMLDRGRLLGRARLVLVVIVGGPDLRLNEIADIMGVLTPLVRSECRLMMGTALDDDWTGRLSVCALVGEKRAVAVTPATPLRQPDPVDDAAADQAPEKPAPGRSGAGKGRAQIRQADLGLEALSKRGRFKDVEPTLLQGEDLDVPTYLRRRLRIEK